MTTKRPWLEAAQAKGNETRQRRAAEFRKPIIEQLQRFRREGVTSREEFARRLNEAGYRLQNGGKWNATMVWQTINRAGKAGEGLLDKIGTKGNAVRLEKSAERLKHLFPVFEALHCSGINTPAGYQHALNGRNIPNARGTRWLVRRSCSSSSATRHLEERWICSARRR